MSSFFSTMYMKATSSFFQFIFSIHELWGVACLLWSWPLFLSLNQGFGFIVSIFISITTQTRICFEGRDEIEFFRLGQACLAQRPTQIVVVLFLNTWVIKYVRPMLERRRCSAVGMQRTWSHSNPPMAHTGVWHCHNWLVRLKLKKYHAFIVC